MKKITRILAMFLAVIMLSMSFSGTAQAASYPLMFMDGDSMGMKIPEGTVGKLKFNIFREYNNEKYHVNIYKGTSTDAANLVATASGSVYSSNSLCELTITVDTAKLGLKQGTYTVEYYMSFYTLFEWHTTPNKYKDRIYVVANVCKGNHSYGSGKVTTQPTCTKEGEKKYTCSRCGVTKVETLSKKAHTYDGGTVTTNPTCTKEGVRTFKCTGCTNRRTESIPKVAHVYDEGKISKYPTCTQDGEKVYTCVNCRTAKKTETIPAAHTWDEGVVIFNPTVSNPGSKDCVCEICGEGGRVAIPPIFSDVYNDWYTSYVQYVYDESLMTGIKGTTKFEPLGNITKAQVAQVLYNMDGKPSVSDNSVFYELQDVYAVEWYAEAVAWAYSTGVVTGDLNAKKFFPNANVTREQLSLMIYRYAAYKGYDTIERDDLLSLKNQENTSNWAREAVEWSVGAGLISGVDKNGVKDLQPQGNASRAQMAAILQRFSSWVEDLANRVPEVTPTPEVTETPEVTPEVTGTPEVTPEVTEAPGEEDNEGSNKGAELAQYIVENGETVSGSAGTFPVINGQYTSNGLVFDCGITYRDDLNRLVFNWNYSDYYYVSFDYDIETQKASSKILYTDLSEGVVTASSTEVFDMSTYVMNKVLDFEITTKVNSTETDAETKESANTFTNLAVLCWGLLLDEQPELTMKEVGFDIFEESLEGISTETLSLYEF